MKNSLYPSLPVLFVDDEAEFLEIARLALCASGITNLELVSDSRQVLPLVAKKTFGVMALDLTMPNISGLDILDAVSRDHPDIVTVVISGMNEVTTAVNCMKKGAFDYLVKPLECDDLATCVKRAIEYREMRVVTAALKQKVLTDGLQQPEAFSRYAGASYAIRQIFKYAEAIAPTDLPILITGETGVGKELMAQVLHEVSRRTGKFVPVNAAGIDDNMLSDALFGHRKGAFTGADQERKGLIEEAADGTLFLDEIGDLHMDSQVKLLRLLQEGTYYPLGGDHPRVSRARVIATTNADLPALISAGRFRKDLYYRLQVHQIAIPPLRDRKGDIPMLANRFIQQAAAKFGKAVPTVPTELFALLSMHDFPGNIRELQAMVFDAVGRHATGTLSLDVFKERIREDRKAQASAATPPNGSGQAILFTDRLPSMQEAENLLIEEALKRAGGNKTLAAEFLGLSRQTLSTRGRKKAA